MTLMPLLLRLAQGGGDALLVFGRDGDHVHAERDPVLDDFVLLGRIRVGRAVEEQFDAEFLGGLVGAVLAGDEVGVALGFGHQRDDELRVRRGGGRDAGEKQCTGGAKTEEEGFHSGIGGG